MSKNLILGTITLSLSIVYLFATQSLPRSALDGPVGTAGFPLLIGWTLFGASLLLMLQSGVALLLGGAHGDDTEVRTGADDQQAPDVWATPLRTAMRAGGFFLIAATFILALPYLGYLLSVFLLIIAATRYQSMPLSGQVLIVAGVGAAAFWLLFVFAMDVPLPNGVFNRWM